MSEMVRDLAVLVADKNMEHALLGVLSRRESLGIRTIEQEIFVHPYRDPGCLRGAAAFLRGEALRSRHGLVVFDREGSGQENKSRDALEHDVEADLRREGWGDRARAIVIDPELEAWVWSDSPHVDRQLGWQDRTPDLRAWLRGRSMLHSGATKPVRPKEAMEAALRATRQRRTSARFKALAEVVSLERCEDAAFRKLKEVLRGWFGENPSG